MCGRGSTHLDGADRAQPVSLRHDSERWVQAVCVEDEVAIVTTQHVSALAAHFAFVIVLVFTILLGGEAWQEVCVRVSGCVHDQRCERHAHTHLAVSKV